MLLKEAYRGIQDGVNYTFSPVISGRYNRLKSEFETVRFRAIVTLDLFSLLENKSEVIRRKCLNFIGAEPVHSLP